MTDRNRQKSAAKRAADKQARNLKLEVARCERCGCSRLDSLECHEILSGIGNRMRARGKRYACLILCNWRANNCHATVQSMRAAEQLAILQRSRETDYDLRAFLELRNPNAPHAIEQAEVDLYLEEP